MSFKQVQKEVFRYLVAWGRGGGRDVQLLWDSRTGTQLATFGAGRRPLTLRLSGFMSARAGGIYAVITLRLVGEQFALSLTLVRNHNSDVILDRYAVYDVVFLDNPIKHANRNVNNPVGSQPLRASAA